MKKLHEIREAKAAKVALMLATADTESVRSTATSKRSSTRSKPKSKSSKQTSSARSS